MDSKYLAESLFNVLCLRIVLILAIIVFISLKFGQIEILRPKVSIFAKKAYEELVFDWNTNFFVDIKLSREVKCAEDEALGPEYENIVRPETWPGTKKGCYVPADSPNQNGKIYTYDDFM